jgi:glyoxylase-like metal-dependent hydrolase (beta-lactamase superfamily II)
MLFHTETEPTREIAQGIFSGVCRIVADNPGPMTYHGTNTYLFETADGLTLLDPGPNSPAHIQAILAAGNGRIARILLTHTHRDHSGAVTAVKAATDAPIYAHRNAAEKGFSLDFALSGGETIANMTAIYTPGHAGDHLCFAIPGGVLFSGDHVMPWSTTVVSPPDGDMTAYFASLTLMLSRGDRLYLSGHGPPLSQPREYVEELLRHRSARESAILALLREGGKLVAQIAQKLYPEISPDLMTAARRNVLAHLLKLQLDGRADRIGELWYAR